jgi:hypothetical protein
MLNSRKKHILAIYPDMRVPIARPSNCLEIYRIYTIGASGRPVVINPCFSALNMASA